MTTAGEMAPVNTSTSTLSVFVGTHASRVLDVHQSGVLSPRHVMHPAEGRAWIPMHTNLKYAADWAMWSCEEKRMTVNHPKNDLFVIKVEFSALGFGHYFLREMLSARNSWSAWRFHGDLPVPEVQNIDGLILATVGLYLMEPEARNHLFGFDASPSPVRSSPSLGSRSP